MIENIAIYVYGGFLLLLILTFFGFLVYSVLKTDKPEKTDKKKDAGTKGA